MTARNMFIALLATASAWTAFPYPGHAADSDEVLVLSFFRDNGQTGIYLAASEDGLHFTPLNNDQPVMKPASWAKQNLTRDPSIVFRDGKFHAVWTTGWGGRCFGYAESIDLVHWSEPVRVEPFPTSLPKEDQPRNMWAPEICWDPVQKDYMIFWSSTTDRESNNGDGSSMDGKNGSNDHRIYVTRTADGKSFSEAKMWFDPKFCCIDGMLVLDESAAGNRWILVYKNEQEIRLGGKNLRLATAPVDFSQPWSLVATPIVGPGTPVRPKEMAEGPSLLRWKQGWYLYWDAFANGHYSMAASTDLQNWTDRTTELQLPPHPRHGTVFRAPRAAVGWLQKPAPAVVP